MDDGVLIMKGTVSNYLKILFPNLEGDLGARGDVGCLK